MLWFPDLTPAQAEAYHRAYLASLPGLVDRLRSRAAAGAGPDLDGSRGSLGPLGRWFAEELARDAPDDVEDWPAWWVHDPGWRPSAVTPGSPQTSLSRRQLHLVDEVGAYLAQVLVGHVPDLVWTVHRSSGRRPDADRNRTVLREPGGRYWDPVSMVYSAANRQEMRGRPPEPDILVVLADRVTDTASRRRGRGLRALLARRRDRTD